MKIFLWLVVFLLLALQVHSQTFEISNIQDSYRGLIGDVIKAPIRVKNNSDRSITLIIRRINAQIGSTQKNYFCLDNDCLDQRIEDYSLRLEPGQTLNALQIALEAGLAQGASVVKYLVFNKLHPSETVEFDINFVIDEKMEKENIYTSRDLTLHDVYPNPVTAYAFVDYKMHGDEVKAKIIIHNILGNPVDEYLLPALENKIKIRAESLSPGIYFYTLYIDNEGVITRKLIVKK